MLDQVKHFLRVTMRAFIAQGIGILGLLWCLFDNHPRVALVLAGLVLIDQALFVRDRFVISAWTLPWGDALRLWCMGMGLTDVALLCATLFQAEGLRERVGATPVTAPLDFLAFSLSSLARMDSGLLATTSGGRLLAAAEGVLGIVAVVAGGAIAVTALLYRRAAAQSADQSESLQPYSSEVDLTGPSDGVERRESLEV